MAKITEEQAKAMCYQDAMKDFFFNFVFFWSSFAIPLSPQVLPSCLVFNIFSTTVTVHSTMKWLVRSSQHHRFIHHLLRLFFVIFNLVLFPTADVFYISIILGLCFILAVPALKPDPFYHLLHLVGVTKCCHNY